MKKTFQTRLEAVEWIAEHARSEGEFETLKEQCMYNKIYTGHHSIELPEREKEVVWLDRK